MKIIRGKYKGLTFTISQFCNDWITPKEIAEVFSLTQVELNPLEMQLIFKNAKDTGIMFGLYTLLPNGRFKRSKP